MVGAEDEREIKNLQLVHRVFEKTNRLLTPTPDDWSETGRILFLLKTGARSIRTGLVGKVGNVERLVNDVLIARTVGAANAILVTANLKDARLIARYQAFDFLGDDDYFEAME